MGVLDAQCRVRMYELLTLYERAHRRDEPGGVHDEKETRLLADIHARCCRLDAAFLRAKTTCAVALETRS